MTSTCAFARRPSSWTIFFAGNTQGFFVGADAVYARLRYSPEETDERRRRNQVWLGPRLGYRFNLGEHFYVTPWVSLMYRTNSGDMEVAGRHFDDEDYLILPAVHLGWRFY